MTNPPPPAEPAGPLREAGERALAGLDQARRKATDVLAATRDKGEAMIDDTREKSYRAAAETNRLFNEHPIAAVAAAAAAGAIFGIFMPRIGIATTAARMARRAVKAAVATEAAQLLVSSVGQAGRTSLPAPAPAAQTRAAAPEDAPQDN